MHDPKAVAGLLGVLDRSPADPARQPALEALCRLHFAESPYEGKWWGTRPDTAGPYYHPAVWERSEAIGQALRSTLKRSEGAEARWLLGEMVRNRLDFEESTALAIRLAGHDDGLRDGVADLLVARPKLSLDAIRFLDGIAAADPRPDARARALRGLIRHQGQQEAREAGLRGLAQVGTADDPAPELVGAWSDYCKDGRQGRDASIARKLAEGADPGRAVLGFGILLQVEGNNRNPETARVEAHQAIARGWDSTGAAPALLRAVGLSKAEKEADRVRGFLTDARTDVRRAAEFAAARLKIDGPQAAAASPKPKKARPIASLPYDAVVAASLKDPGDPALGSEHFEKLGCVNCHGVRKSDPIKGPYLGDVAARYNRSELAESILKPSARIAQGFETQKLALTSGQTYEGFVVREAGDEVELRNATGAVAIIPKKEIEERNKSELSVMPQGLLDTLGPHDLASILAYLESLKGK